MAITCDLSVLSSQKYKLLTIRSKAANSYLLLESIIYITSCEGYSCFYLVDGSRYQSCQTLKKYEVLLSNEGFVRISKSCIINRLHLKHYDILARKVQMHNNIKLTVSVRRVKSLR